MYMYHGLNCYQALHLCTHAHLFMEKLRGCKVALYSVFFSLQFLRVKLSSKISKIFFETSGKLENIAIVWMASTHCHSPHLG